MVILDLLDRVWAWMTAYADHGDNPNVLDGPEWLRKCYVVAIRANFTVAKGRTGAMARQADVLTGSQPLQSWRSVTWRKKSQI